MADRAIADDREDPSVVSEEVTDKELEEQPKPAGKRGSQRKTQQGPVGRLCSYLTGYCDCGGQRQAETRKHWAPWRTFLASIVESANFDMVMGAVIVFNVYVMIVEADDGAACPSDGVDDCTQDWVKYTNYALLVIYTLEVLTRGVVYQAFFFHNTWNLLDFLIVVIGVLDLVFSESLSGVGVARMLRLGRLARLVKLLKSFPELHSMIKGFYGTMTTIFWGFILILALLLISSLVSVEILHPRNMDILKDTDPDAWCYKAWSSVGHSIIYYFQTLVTGDSWGACAIPVIRVYPWTAIVFGISYITVQLGFTNLVLAVIVDAAAKAREADTAERIREKKQAEKEATERLKAITVRMDKDKSGTISWDEMEESYHTDEDMQELLALLDIDKEDLKSMFRLMDADQSGTVSYDEFVDCISKAEEQDARVQLMMLKLHVHDITIKLEKLIGPIVEDPGQKPAEEVNEAKEKVEAFKTPTEEIALLESKLGVLRTDLLVRLETLSHDAEHQVSLLTSQTKTLSASVAASQKSRGGSRQSSPRPQEGTSAGGSASPSDNPNKDSSGRLPAKPKETAAPKPTALGRFFGTGSAAKSGQGPGGLHANV